MSNENSTDYYQLLHVQPDAPTEVIKASYRVLMQKLKLHPDLGGDNIHAALVNQAFDTLTDAVKRAEYDKKECSNRLIGACQSQYVTIRTKNRKVCSNNVDKVTKTIARGTGFIVNKYV